MSIQQHISSEIYRMADHAVTPDQIKAVQAHLVKGVQDGAIPSYVGVPLLSDLNQKMGRIQSAAQQSQAMINQPPIAQQVMGQAEQGVSALPSGLPAQGMAGGGIVAFGEGGLSDEDYDFDQEDDQDDDEDFLDSLVSQHAEQFPMMATKSRESASYKETGMPEKSVSHETETVSHPAGDIEKMAAEKAAAIGLDPRLAHHVLQKETGNLKDRAHAVSPAGAMGVMQLMPATARYLGVKDPFNAEENIGGGIRYLKQNMDKYHDPKLAAIAYNWGPGNTDKWLAAGADPSALPRETQKYVVGLKEGGVAHFADGNQVKGIQYAPSSFGNAANNISYTPEELAEQARLRNMGLLDLIKEKATPVLSPIWQALTTPASGAQTRQTTYQSGIDIGGPGSSPANMGAASTQPITQPTQQVASQPTVTPAPEQQASASTPPLGPMDIGLGVDQFTSPSDTSGGTQGSAEPTGIEALFKQYNEETKKDKESNAYMALLAAGLGMMGGTSPFGFANIGQGALQGVKTYEQLGQSTGADRRAILNAQVAAERNKDLQAIRQLQLDVSRGALEERKRSALSGEEIKKLNAEDRESAKASSIIRQMKEEAATNARLRAKSRIDSAAKDFANPLTDEGRQQIYEDENAAELQRLNQDPLYRKQMKIAVPGYEPSEYKNTSSNRMSSDRMNQFKVER